MSQAADRIYYDEPATLEFTAEVSAIREVARVDGRQVWQIALDRTAFYPTSGGQPHDTGVLIATARSGASLEVPITVVEEDEAGEVWHTTSKPLQEGTAVQGRVDAARRRDHMQQHSGQHLLSAMFVRECAASTTSFHLGETESTIDLDVSSIDDGMMQRVEEAANAAIRAALPFLMRYVSAEESAGMKAAGVLRKLPPRAGRIRIVEIPGTDANACGGTHVATSAEIGPLLLRGSETSRGAIRVSFVCGERAIVAARADFHRLRGLAQTLTTSVDAIRDSVERMKGEQKSQAKTVAALLQEMAGYEAARLAAGVDVVVHTLPEGRDAAYAKLLASRVVRETAASVALLATAEANLVLAAKAGGADCGTVLRTVLATFGGRGGGSAEMAQGSVPPASCDAAVAALRAALPV